MKSKSKKGSYILEAAVVLPVIIMVTITAVLIIMFFYEQMTQQCRLHIVLREEAGITTEKTIYMAEYPSLHDDAVICRENTVYGNIVYGKKYLIMANQGVLINKGTFIAEGRWHITDGSDYVRYRSVIRGLNNE